MTPFSKAQALKAAGFVVPSHPVPPTHTGAIVLADVQREAEGDYLQACLLWEQEVEALFRSLPKRAPAD